MRPLAFLLSLALAVGAFASNAPDWLVGSYRLELSPELKSAAQKLGVPEPYVRIMLRPDGTFSYASNKGGNVTGANGTFELSDGHLTLTAKNEFPGQGVKSLNGTARNGAIEIDGLRYVKAGSALDLVGTWNVRSGSQVDKSIKMVFKENHTFEFSGMSATSRGRYEVNGDQLTLKFMEVDGEGVEPESMRKVVTLTEDGFSIDTYHYVKG